MRTFVIAEAGSTWRIGQNQRHHLAKALKCIRVAKAAGADCCKFQWVSDPRAMEQRRTVPKGTYDILAWPKAWLKLLAAECEEAGIEFMCSVFIPADVATIAPFVKRFKVASLEGNDQELIEAMEAERVRITTQHGPYPYVPRSGYFIKPIIVSVGAAESWNACPAYGVMLHCVCAYPAPLDQMNLGVLRTQSHEPYGQGWSPSWYGGLSDHSGDVLTGALAVACGAEIIEVHFRLDETRSDNPDFAHSHSPAGLKTYVQNIRKAELMLGDGVKKIEKCERAMVQHRVTA